MCVCWVAASDLFATATFSGVAENIGISTMSVWKLSIYHDQSAH